MAQPTLRELIADVRRVLVRLERFEGQRLPIDQAILEALTDAGDMSTAAIATLIRRRQGDVRRTLRLLHEARRITRRNEKWGLNESE
jgi:transcription initiation factor IIE alpha subunit